jgi:hypothetical protein
MHPAISPSFERSGSVDHDLEWVRSRTPSAPSSRPASRARSLHGAPSLTRYNSRGEEHEETHTSLEDVEEYEPLFPEDDVKGAKPISTVERLKKRPNLLKHRFPSQDIWEDTPDSLQLHASVTTPDLPKAMSGNPFDLSEVALNRRKQPKQMDPLQVAPHPLESAAQPQDSQSHPDTIKQRFPSRDIWEDAPDSQQLITTIEPHDDEIKTSPDVPSKPTLPLLTVKAKPEAPQTIPSRPQRSTKMDLTAKGVSPEATVAPIESRKAPALPDRPKPLVPARISKPRNLPENAPKETPGSFAVSSEPTTDTPSPPSTKLRPAVPARPAGSKIAGLKADFLSSLNSRLQLGPQGPKPAEKPEAAEVPIEKAPLGDARKGRSRGPVRRKPATAIEIRLPSIPEIRIMDAWNVWQVGQDGHLAIGEGVNLQELESWTEGSVEAPAGESLDPSGTNEPAASEVRSFIEGVHVPISPTIAKLASNDAPSTSIVPEVTPSEERSPTEAKLDLMTSPAIHENESAMVSASDTSTETKEPASHPENTIDEASEHMDEN